MLGSINTFTRIYCHHCSVHNQRSVLQIIFRSTRSAAEVLGGRCIGTVIIISHTILTPIVLIKQIQRAIYRQCGSLLHLHHSARVHDNPIGKRGGGAFFKDYAHVRRKRQVVIRSTNRIPKRNQRDSTQCGISAYLHTDAVGSRIIPFLDLAIFIRNFEYGSGIGNGVESNVVDFVITVNRPIAMPRSAVVIGNRYLYILYRPCLEGEEFP